jgi:hypothetical protein
MNQKNQSGNIFYKYAGDSGIQILEGLRIKITPPNEFNDPFELTPRSKFAITLDEMRGRLKTNPESYRGVWESMRADGHSNTFEELLTELTKQLPLKFKGFEKLMREYLIEKDMKSLNEASEILGIFCVSRISSSIPMWSHYANNHKGVAIGINFSKVGGKLPGTFEQVTYRKTRRGVNPWLLSTNPEWLKQIKDTLFIKSRDWMYEQEYRRVFRLSDLNQTQPDIRGRRHYFLDITGDDINEIIFGCRIDVSYENQIREELCRRPKTFGHIKMFRCKRHDTKFELKIVSA